ncbi:MAG TPA: protein tyrosine phosphatase family protein [Anaerolineales bacterium]|nr:protein tyrosine phosphatase family protein [Anaerolineales bacterium]
MNDIYHYMFLNEQLSSSGMPTAEQMRSVAEAGVQVVINLAPHDVPHPLPDESELVNTLGMEYINIPVIWRAPAAEALTRFMDEMDAHADKKIHVHCEANYRASAFIMLYRVLRLDWKKEDAIPVMEKMWNPEDFPIWQNFIDEQLANQ